jgi:hypothetical protein
MIISYLWGKLKIFVKKIQIILFKEISWGCVENSKKIQKSNDIDKDFSKNKK